MRDLSCDECETEKRTEAKEIVQGSSCHRFQPCYGKNTVGESEDEREKKDEQIIFQSDGCGGITVENADEADRDSEKGRIHASACEQRSDDHLVLRFVNIVPQSAEKCKTNSESA